MPASVVLVLVADGFFLAALALYALPFLAARPELDALQVAVLAADLALCAGFIACMVAFARRLGWARPLNLVAVWIPMAFWAVVAVAAALNMAGVGPPDASAGFGLFYSVVFALGLAAPVAVVTGLLVAAPGLRAWLRMAPA